MANKAVRQSVSLPAKVAAQVRTMARTRRLSANRMLVELIENGIEAEKQKQQEFFDLASLARRELPRDLASDEDLLAKLPAFFRAAAQRVLSTQSVAQVHVDVSARRGCGVVRKTGERFCFCGRRRQQCAARRA